MKILVIGHKGMLGSTIMSRFAGSMELIGKDVDEMDITSPSSCQDIVMECAPAIVINASAYTNVDGAEKNRDKCFAVNADGIKNIALACAPQNIKIVHISTDYVFDGNKMTSYNEKDNTAPINAYGSSKLAGEIQLAQNSSNYLIIRTAWLYGSQGNNFVKTILKKSKETKDLKVVSDQFGSPTYCYDLAGAIKILIDGGHTGLFHITNRGSCSWYDFSKKILQLKNISDVSVKPVSSTEFLRDAKRPTNSVLDCSEFTRTTGKIMRPWQIALSDFLEKESIAL
ncbi:MAG: dTDP-4-dehydrorhamnose reductase [Deltaproteobacteria bacterium]